MSNMNKPIELQRKLRTKGQRLQKHCNRVKMLKQIQEKAFLNK